MFNVTDILSKEVLSLSDAAPIGIIENAYLSPDLSRMKGWTVVVEDSDDEGLLPLSRIIGTTDAVTVMNASAVKAPSGIKCPLGRHVYDSEGRVLGVLREIIMDERGNTQALLIGESSYAPSDVLRASKNVVILRAPNHSSLIVRRAPLHKPVRVPRPIIPEEKADGATAMEERNMTAYGEYAFLIGRTVSKDILAAGSILAKEGTQVDATVVEAARAKGKLVELTVNSRKA